MRRGGSGNRQYSAFPTHDIAGTVQLALKHNHTIRIAGFCGPRERAGESVREEFILSIDTK